MVVTRIGSAGYRVPHHLTRARASGHLYACTRLLGMPSFGPAVCLGTLACSPGMQRCEPAAHCPLKSHSSESSQHEEKEAHGVGVSRQKDCESQISYPWYEARAAVELSLSLAPRHAHIFCGAHLLTQTSRARGLTTLKGNRGGFCGPG